MAVLVEALSVVIKAKRLAESYPGGWEAFAGDAPNETLCSDGAVVRLGFMKRADVEACIRGLTLHGLVHLRDGRAEDIVVVDQHRGPIDRCDWIQFGKMQDPRGDISVCRLVGTTEDTFVAPAAWSHDDTHRSYEQY